MAYCLYTDMEARLGTLRCAELTNDTSGATTTDQTVAGALITRADTLIDAKMTGYYATPFSSVPKLIKQISIDIACYYAFMRRFVGMEMPKEWEATYKQALILLDDISNGKITLDTSPTVASAESAIVAPTKLIDFDDTDKVESFF